MRQAGACTKLVFSGARSSEVLSVCLIWSVVQHPRARLQVDDILSVVGMEHGQPLLAKLQVEDSLSVVGMAHRQPLLGMECCPRYHRPDCR